MSQQNHKEQIQPKALSSEEALASLYSSLDDLVALRFHVKQYKLNSQQKVLEQTSGGHPSLRKGSGMIFSEVRQYQPGDDIRHIDWRVSARTQKVHTKVFSEEHEKPVLLVTEQSPALFFGSRVQLKAAQALNVAALLGWIALHQNDQVGGMAFNQTQQAWIAPKRQSRTLLQWFHQALHLQHQLKQPGTTTPEPWQQACQQLSRQLRPGSKIFLIGDLLNFNDATLDQLRNLRKQAEITAIHIYDPLEKNLPQQGWLSFTSGWFSDRILPLNSAQKTIRSRYRHNYVSRWQALQKRLQTLHIPLVEVSTQQAALPQLIQHRVIQ
ncbi:DUF58 domain-containing protein [Thiomicrorhabdus sp. zzn3]|uniref:DUF58 domain-containing protein n=1 Tax=Thiomicrorhabdus sp. zzn3 TaxID=3039775 RepID=UPI002436DFB2|nr:DUF58 domain-containing protein [Thiomicrorhabdus sp. zzn3]MDG6778796.1 DUF58 domain-containing protein [Thiomicrorhabdus sp. zzn3]